MNKAIFIDRDGTLIEEVGYLKMIEDMRFTPHALDALRIFHDLGYRNIVVTNQSAVARGLLSPKELKKIHKRLLELTAEEGAKVDAVYFCPHLPEGRMAPYNVECDCRKPKPGMILQAQQKMHLDLSQCFAVGDKATDLEFAQNAGVPAVLVLTGYGKQTRDAWPAPVETFANLYEFAKSLASRAAVAAPPAGQAEDVPRQQETEAEAQPEPGGQPHE